MSQGPRRLIEDPDWGAAFEGLRDEHGVIEGLPDDVRADVALMIAASVAGAVGVTAAGAAASSLASAGSTGVATGSVSSAIAGGASSATAAAGSVMASSSVAASSGVVASSGVLAGSSVAAVGSGVASAVGAATAAGTLGAASASLAALGIVPKVIAVLSVAGAMTVGGVAVVKNTQSRTHVVAPSAENEADAEPYAVMPDQAVGRRNIEANRLSAAPVKEYFETGVAAHEIHSEANTEKVRDGESKSVPEARPAEARAGGPTGLAGEVSLLGRARAALSTNREYAWTLLSEYHRRYPEGALRAEYETLVRRVQTTPGSESAASAMPAAEVR